MNNSVDTSVLRNYIGLPLTVFLHGEERKRVRFKDISGEKRFSFEDTPFLYPLADVKIRSVSKGSIMVEEFPNPENKRLTRVSFKGRRKIFYSMNYNGKRIYPTQ